MFDRNMNVSAHRIITNHLMQQDKKELIAVDGTVGNGYDLLFLCTLEKVGHIIGFDIQKEAIAISQNRIIGCDKPIELILDSHHCIDRYVEKVDVAMFNLGYLPKGNKTIVTQLDTSLLAIQKTINLLADDGILTIMTYKGHEEGYKESKGIATYLSQLFDKGINVFNLSLENTHTPCPNLYVIIKRQKK